MENGVLSSISRTRSPLILKFSTITHTRMLKSWQLYVLLVPSLVWLVLFAYYPMYGLLIAFKDFRIRAGILASPWADPLFEHFSNFFSTSIASTVISNTIILSLLTLLIGFPIPIIFAILLNQIKGKKGRKFIQTVSYAPYFLSSVVIVSLISVLFSATGVVNYINSSFGNKIIFYTSEASWFRTLYIGSGIWQTMGFNAVIFVAALTGISPEYYEAATVDGATKLQQIWHIELPLILPTIVLMLILAIGNIMNVGYEKAFLMQNGMNTVVSELISTYVYKVGLQTAQYSFATAVGLFNSVVNFVILIIANTVAKKIANISML